MSPAVTILIELGIRLLVFTGVFWFAAKRNKNIIIEKRWATPLVALVFAVLNTALYWVLEPVLDFATLGVAGFAMPLVINGGLLYATMKIFEKKKWFRIEGMLAALWMAIFLTIAHGVLWLGIDYVPAHV